MPWSIDDLDTPCVIVDLDKVEANLRRAQDYADAHKLPLRPHIKTHKIPEFAHRQVQMGAIGITCQKLGEVEVMADAGIRDILLSYSVIGRPKLARLVALARRIHLRVVADCNEVAQGLSAAADGAGLTLEVLVECDTGAQRCGVQSPEEAVALARTIDRLPGLSFAGIMTYPPKHGVERNAQALRDIVAALAAAGLEARIVSNGGTPDLYRAHEVDVATEHRPGTYIYSDRSIAAAGVGTLADCALKVVSTVVSRPTDGRAIFDAGSKTLSSDTLGLDGYGHVEEYPSAVIYGFSEEHAHVDVSGANTRPRVGERVTIIPNHACVVSNLHDHVFAVRGREVERVLRVAARGLVT